LISFHFTEDQSWRVTRRQSITSNDWANIRRRRPKRQAHTGAAGASGGGGGGRAYSRRPLRPSARARRRFAPVIRAPKQGRRPAVPSHAHAGNPLTSNRVWVQTENRGHGRRFDPRFDAPILSALTKPRRCFAWLRQAGRVRSDGDQCQRWMEVRDGRTKAKVCRFRYSLPWTHVSRLVQLVGLI
jgi:hypothetical protein